MPYPKTELTEFSENSVSIKTVQCIMENGVEYALSDPPPHRCSFVNSERGRNELLEAYNNEEVSETDYTAIMTKWGSEPSVIEIET